MSDLYNDFYLRRWSLDLETGRKECIEDAVDVRTISISARDAIEALNADIHQAMEDVENLGEDTPVEIIALAHLRNGEATDEDIEAVANRWGYGVEVEHVEPVPNKVSAAQAKLALDAAEILDNVTAMIDAHPVKAVQIWYVDANEWERWNPYVLALGLEMGLSDEMIDALFVSAKRF